MHTEHLLLIGRLSRAFVPSVLSPIERLVFSGDNGGPFAAIRGCVVVIKLDRLARSSRDLHNC